MPERFERSLEVLRERLYWNGPDGSREPLACHMHKIFGSLEGTRHNCLGCNFADATNGIEHALVKIIAAPSEIEVNFTDYALWLYLFVERANIVFDIIQLPESARCRHFDVFITIKRWANFLKHPNWFILVHHPSYFFEGDSAFDCSHHSAIVDTAFVRDNFNAEAKSRSAAVRQKLQNKADIAVLFPDPKTLTEQFCEAASKFFDLAEKNEVYREILANISTYETYFSEEKKA